MVTMFKCLNDEAELVSSSGTTGIGGIGGICSVDSTLLL